MFVCPFVRFYFNCLTLTLLPITVQWFGVLLELFVDGCGNGGVGFGCFVFHDRNSFFMLNLLLKIEINNLQCLTSLLTGNVFVFPCFLLSIKKYFFLAGQFQMLNTLCFNTTLPLKTFASHFLNMVTLKFSP